VPAALAGRSYAQLANRSSGVLAASFA